MAKKENEKKDWKAEYLFVGKNGDEIICVCQKPMSSFKRAPLEKAYRCCNCGHEIVFDDRYIYTKIPKKDFRENKIPYAILYGEDKTVFSAAFDQGVLALEKEESYVEDRSKP